MITLDFDLIKTQGGYNTTIVDLHMNKTSVSCLIDTGAYLAIWCAGLEEFLIKYPDSIYTNNIAFVGGFGNGTNIAPVYSIPVFVLSDGKNEIRYHNFLIAIIDKDFSFDLILGYSIFNKSNISINSFSSKGSVHTIPSHMIINFIRQDMYINPIQHQLRSNEERDILQKYQANGIIQAISVFTQD